MSKECKNVYLSINEEMENESLFSKDLWIEINYVVEDNGPMINAINKLEAAPSGRYRVYEMEIS